ncbi:hypothetical protein ASPCADRAFT_211848 [Aspergillus carbonarius ITEM 5010]|uniref:SWIM-type domain-containing protein n=1 Tax=Aspergillus carbonarius (strain ITEM 5010) TaxID=602072 RepID=A0A1R3R830_ASPC5|nr:hypothetical protein ASPCADRAFT_211848 [Aspergillus carbonarius ITEM 5010]
MHSIEFTDYAQQILNREAGLARFYQVVISSDSLFQVSREGRSRQVDLDRSTCSCTDFQEYQLPCRHAIAAIHAVGRQISSFVHPRYLQESYRSTYKAVFMPVNDDFLADDPDCGPCYLRREKGSNGKARRIHGHRLFTRQSKCSACGQDGHYRSSKDCPLKGSNPTAVETSERPGKAWMHTPSGFTEEAIPGSEETSENEDLVQLEKDLEKAAAENCKET